MFKYICEKLGLNLSSERNQSPNLKAVAKSKHGQAAVTTGNYSPIQMPEGDINIINTYPPVLAVMITNHGKNYCNAFLIVQ